ncbi:hypothetical protein ACODT3_42725 [Streptomyces sp. 4.24]|uniref:hypothetical protein n=1 Tax=Streptomyces tritrimontium TaxID=3406573 RepID=UPI003BB53D94
MPKYTVALVLDDNNEHEGTAVFAGHLDALLTEDHDTSRTVVRHVEADSPMKAIEQALDMVLRKAQAEADAWVLAEMEDHWVGGEPPVTSRRTRPTPTSPAPPTPERLK